MKIHKYQKGKTVYEGHCGAAGFSEIKLGKRWRDDNIRPAPIDDYFLDKHGLDPIEIYDKKRKFEPEMTNYKFKGCDYEFRYKHEIENYFDL